MWGRRTIYIHQILDIQSLGWKFAKATDSAHVAAHECGYAFNGVNVLVRFVVGDAGLGGLATGEVFLSEL